VLEEELKMARNSNVQLEGEVKRLRGRLVGLVDQVGKGEGGREG